MSAAQTLSDALVGRYRIENELGAGGMATVYLAHDLRHDRDVAIKVLHPDLGAALGGERFLSEIRTTARLQHPHILPLLDSGSADGLLYYVMPLATGETLRARLERERQLPIDDAIRIAREVADALGHAHGLGIIHRDIKPENILLQGGHALVADFGIALAVQTAAGARMTQTGLSLGTPQYMSPEQAMGERTIDARSDIYALGAVTYEMLAGEPPFTGSSVQAIVAKVLAEKPTQLRTLRDTVPSSIEQTVLTALAKLPADRFATVAAFAAALTSATQDEVTRSTPRAPRASTRTRLMRATAGVALVGTIAGAYWLGSWKPDDGGRTFEWIRFTVEPPGGYRLRDAEPGLSADGRTLVFLADSAGRTRLFARDLRHLTLSAVPGTENADIASPAVSPDGKWVAFYRDDRLVRVPIDRAQQALPVGPRVRFERVGVAGALSWAEDGAILAIPDPAGALLRVDVERDQVDTVRVVRLDAGEFLISSPAAIADGTVIMFGLMSHDGWNLMARDRRTGREQRIVAGASGGWLLGSDRLVYSKAAGLYSVRFNARGLEVIGNPEPLETGLPNDFFAASHETYARGTSGVLAFIGGDVQPGEGPLVRVAMSGRVTPLGVRGTRPRYAPNGSAIAFEDSAHTWILELTPSMRNTMFAQSGLRFVPIWSADGSRIVTSAYDRGGPAQLTSAPVRASGDEQDLSKQQGIRRRYASSVTPDDKTLAVVEVAAAGTDILFLDAQGATTGTLATRANEYHARFSPDGRWLAFTSDESGRPEVYVSEYPVRGRPVAVSVSGGVEPVWHPSGADLFYRSGDTIRSVAVIRGGKLSIGVPTTVTRIPGIRASDRLSHAYDVAPSGRELVGALEPAEPKVRTLVVLVTAGVSRRR